MSYRCTHLRQTGKFSFTKVKKKGKSFCCRLCVRGEATKTAESEQIVIRKSEKKSTHNREMVSEQGRHRTTGEKPENFFVVCRFASSPTPPRGGEMTHARLCSSITRMEKRWVEQRTYWSTSIKRELILKFFFVLFFRVTDEVFSALFFNNFKRTCNSDLKSKFIPFSLDNEKASPRHVFTRIWWIYIV